MLRNDWNPAEVGDFMAKWEHAQLPSDGELNASDAGRLQLVFSQMADELGDLLAQAIYYEEQCKFKKKNAFSLAMMKSNRSSDRQREAEANQDPSVRIADHKLIEATAYKKLLELRHEGAVRSHYACRLVAKEQEQGKWT